MIERQSTAPASPFDGIVMLDNGGERWSARDLMTAMGYSAWREFLNAIDKARKSAENVGTDTATNFVGAHKVAASGPDAQDFHLTRYAAYLVAMNCDPRKPEVAQAQLYFAVRTRESEVAAAGPAVPVALPTKRELAQMVIAAEDRAEAAEQRVEALEPGAAAHAAFMDADGLFSMEAAAKALGYGRNILFKDLRRLGVIQANRLPYQRYAHHFEVKAGTYTNRVTGELVPTATTYVRPAGLDFLRRKLTNAVEAIEMAGANA